MKSLYLSAAIAPLLMFAPATAQALDADAAQEAKAADAPIKSAGAKASGEAVFSTGVAKGRDRLDSATSTSALPGAEIESLSARSLGEVLRHIPGIRAEYVGGEGNANYSIRGLPLSGTGSKYVQLQEDGLPVLEFGDLQPFTTDMFMRSDLNLAQIETIRGGSASTFASNSPGGVINLISKTGDTEGGALAGTLGVGYGERRIDGDYGYKLSDTLRVHVGGFYREGEGPREVGYKAYRGGQLKFNVTKQLDNGYLRFHAKWLNDRTPTYQDVPFKVTGTNGDPSFESLPGLDLKDDSLLSNNIRTVARLDKNNNVVRHDVADGQHADVKSVGFEAQIDLSGWTITERFRFAAISGSNTSHRPVAVAPAAALAFVYGGPGGRLSYASGPQAGQAINPLTLNGNGLLTSTIFIDVDIESLDNATNDLRASRVWSIGGGNFTTTVGFYKASQDYDTDWALLNVLTDVRGDGQASLINVATAAGVPTTQDGHIFYGVNGGVYRRNYNVNYGVNAPYASVNYHRGKVAIGGSLRYDFGKVDGILLGEELGGGRVGVKPTDINGDGRISGPEAATASLPLGRPGLVDYNYKYLSYSTGVNYRIAEPLAVFARYSRGGRASADKILFTPVINYNTGKLIDRDSAYDTVKQAELGLKYRVAGLTFNMTGFSARTGERNSQVNTKPDGSIQVENIVRGYKAKGVEFEAGYRTGAFSVTAGATYTDAKISSDLTNPGFVGNTPRHQADLIFSVTPQYETKYVTVGADLIGTTSSFAQDTNQLKLPGYTLVNAFVQVRPMERVQLTVNVNNLFDSLEIADVQQASLPAGGLVLGRAYNGRTVSGTLRYAF